MSPQRELPPVCVAINEGLQKIWKCSFDAMVAG
jgi:hypothetical protein